MSTQTPLEEIKSIEAQSRKLALLEVIKELKDRAKEVKENKLYTDLLLKELGYSDKDAKSIIDYINSQVEADEKDISKEVKRDLKEMSEKGQKRMQNVGYTVTNYSPLSQNLSYTSGTAMTTANSVSATDTAFVAKL